MRRPGGYSIRTESAARSIARWLTKLLDRRPARVAAIALANKLARMLGDDGQGENYREPIALAKVEARWERLGMKRDRAGNGVKPKLERANST